MERLDYRIRRPIERRTRPATCEEVQCEAWVNGWVSAIDETTPLGRQQAEYIRQRSGRTFVVHVGEDGLTRFTFAPGQTCFQSGDHRVEITRVEHDPRWLRRSNLQGTRELGVESWLDDFATEADRLRTFQERHG
jgi:hypothetical protein